MTHVMAGRPLPPVDANASVDTNAQVDPALKLLVPDGRRRRPRGHDRDPGPQRGAHRRRLRGVVPRGPRGGRRGRRDPHRRQLDRRTAEIALAARRPGAARARSAGSAAPTSTRCPFVRGKYVIMGDADCTYDFRQLAPFVEALREGYEFVMGSRWQGSIEPGAMPRAAPVLRHAGHDLDPQPPVLGSHFTDIHCGMRGITRDALCGWTCSPQSWEYASEMVLKSVHMDLRTAEVPVTFLKDREGRLSHHKRSGWFSPFDAAWINLRAMFVYGAEFFLFKPGIVLLAARPAADAAAELRRRSRSAASPSVCTGMFLGVALSSSACRASTSAAWRRCCSTTPAADAALATSLPVHRARSLISGRCSLLGLVAGRRRSLSPTSRSDFALRPRRRDDEPPGRHRADADDRRRSRPSASPSCCTPRRSLRSRQMTVTDTERSTARSGRSGELTVVDRFGVWLSQARRSAARVGDVWPARTSATSAAATTPTSCAARSARCAAATLVDLALAADLKPTAKVTRHRGHAARTSCRAARRPLARRRALHVGARAPLGAGRSARASSAACCARAASAPSTCRRGAASAPSSSPPSASASARPRRWTTTSVLRPEGPLAAAGPGRLHAAARSAASSTSSASTPSRSAACRQGGPVTA